MRVAVALKYTGYICCRSCLHMPEMLHYGLKLNQANFFALTETPAHIIQ